MTSPSQPGRHFEQRVGERERAEHRAHLHEREPEVLSDERRGDRDADAIEVGNDREKEGESKNPVADT
jgi:hypothetical protein